MTAPVASDNAPKAIGPYSQAIDTGSFVFVSGQTPMNPDGTVTAKTVPEQTTRCLDNIEAILRAAGMSLGDVVKTTVFMTDLSKFTEMNEVYGKRFTMPYPARATVEVSRLPKDVAVEIEAIAIRR